eukprot:TRINITY_DN15569_c0_g1_i5.p1 TRINITY_DN15569_c0_g1~~TRINITY_DN15569_c0_g1_i5.p1  ORF type:complete len:810 (-),score=174.60 TRINITY_DN15569_c0_g1_i5:104-2533(-)
MSEEDLSSILVTEATKRDDGPKGNYYLDFSQSFDENFEVCGMSPSSPSSITSEPRLPSPGNLTHLPVAPPDPRILDPAHDSSMSSAASENTVIAAENESKESWSNTFESNYTDTSVDEPKYAKVNHKKRNSKLCSGNSTPKVKRRKPSDSRLSRENSSKYDRNSVQIHTSSPAIIIQAMVDTERSNQIQTLEAIEDTALDRTVTDKSADIQDSTKDANDSLQRVLTSLYANILIIFGLVLPLTTVKSETDQRHFEVFYIFLFLGSLLFLIFVYMDLLHTKTRVAVKSHKKKRSLLTVKESLGDSGRSSKSSSSAGRVKKDSQLLPGLPSDLLHNVDSFNSLLPQPTAHYGSFFLRLGTVFFGIGSLIYIGIEMGGLFEVGFLENHLSTCGDMFNILRPTLQIAFVFFQMYFIFLNHKMNIYKRKFVTRFGLMHMIATNVCVWIKALVMEANHEVLNFPKRNIRDVANISFIELNVNEIDFDEDLMNETVFSDSDEVLELEESDIKYMCDNPIIYQLKQDSSPYLYPCLVQFSLICGAVLLIMWRNVASEHKHYKLAKLKIGHYQDRYDYSSTCQRYSVDCNGSNTGLFCGVMVIIATIVSLIVFFVFITNTDQNLQNLAVQFASFSELGLYGLTSVAVMIGMCQMRRLWYDVSRRLELDIILLVTGQAGVLIYASFSAVGSFLQIETCLVSLLASITTLVQTILQTAFIIDASHRFASTPSHIRHKPGRQVVTFLLVCNLAMWVVNILETNKTSASKNQVNFMEKEWLWPVITQISIPLAIFYRFHSASCLYEIWKKSFKYKPANIDYI